MQQLWWALAVALTVSAGASIALAARAAAPSGAAIEAVDPSEAAPPTTPPELPQWLDGVQGAPRQYLAALIKQLEAGAALVKEYAGRSYELTVGSVRVVKARFEVREIAKLLQFDIVAGHDLPADFDAYVRRHMDGAADPTLDPWGNKYLLDRGEAATYVRSCGVDKMCATADDITYLVLKH